MITLTQCILLTGLMVGVIIVGVYVFQAIKKKIQVMLNIREIKRNVLEDIAEERLKKVLSNPPIYHTFKCGCKHSWPWK